MDAACTCPSTDLCPYSSVHVHNTSLCAQTHMCHTTRQAVVTQAIPEHVEDRVPLVALARRVRTTEFFKDFNKLMTGYITMSVCAL